MSRQRKASENKGADANIYTSSIEIKDDKFFSMQRGKAHTVMVKTSLKANRTTTGMTGNSLLAPNENTNTAKESVKRTLNEIEDNFKTFKYLPNQKLHPFDLTAEELIEIKQFFPEFYPKNLTAKR